MPTEQDYREERRRYAERLRNAPKILAEKKTWNYSIFGAIPAESKPAKPSNPAEEKQQEE